MLFVEWKKRSLRRRWKMKRKHDGQKRVDVLFESGKVFLVVFARTGRVRVLILPALL